MTTPPNDKLTEAHERMVEAVRSLVSGEDWVQMLDVARRFHNYSPGNVLLISSASGPMRPAFADIERGRHSVTR